MPVGLWLAIKFMILVYRREYYQSVYLLLSCCLTLSLSSSERSLVESLQQRICCKDCLLDQSLTDSREASFRDHQALFALSWRVSLCPTSQLYVYDGALPNCDPSISQKA